MYRELRPAQARVLDVYGTEHLETPDVAIELPTGVGKTLIALLIADWALDQGRSVAYLTGTKQLAEQVEDQARDLPGLAVHRFFGGHYPGAALDDYHQAQGIGLMNYWVYFNSSPRVQPADLVILDDAHIAEQPLTGLFGLRIPRRSDPALYSSLCDLVLAHTGAYSTLQAMKDASAPLATPPELLAFNDWAAVLDPARAAIERSEFAESDEARWVWPELRGRLERCGVLIGPSAIEIRPYHPPTQLFPGYARAKGRIYMSATLGTMDDLQRRLGVKRVLSIEVPPELHRGSTGRRLFLLNPSADPIFSNTVLEFALDQAARAGRAAWLCASHAEADQVEGFLSRLHHQVFRLRPGDDAQLEAWRGAPSGHLVAAGRFDGLDLAEETCRLVILPSVPAASTEFERFVVAYLGDAAFMRHRVGQRTTQALGRANRTEDDWALYLGLDPGFAGMLANPAVRGALGAEVGQEIRRALELHAEGWGGVREAANRFWTGDDVAAEDVTTARRPGRAVAGAHRVESAPSEVEASTSLWLGDFPAAADAAADAAVRLREAGETEHGAFWQYVEAHGRFTSGTADDLARAKDAIAGAISEGPRTAWFVRLRRTLDELEGRTVAPTVHDDLFLAWDEWLRETTGSILDQLNRARQRLDGTHDEQAEAILTLARLCGARAERPTGASATDVRWTWITPERTERRLWEVKTGTGGGTVRRRDVNQLLGQIEVESQRQPRARVRGCLLTPLTQLDADAAAAARERIAVIHTPAVISLFDLLADRFRAYQSLWGGGTAAERGAARSAVEPRLPQQGWLNRILAPSAGRCRTRDDIDSEFSG